MDYVDAAAVLGMSITESDDFKNFRSAEAGLLADYSAQQLIMDYQELQQEMVEKARDQSTPQEELNLVRDALLAKKEEVETNEITKAYFDAKEKFDMMMHKINTILEHYMSDQSGCTGSCSTCGGCH